MQMTRSEFFYLRSSGKSPASQQCGHTRSDPLRRGLDIPVGRLVVSQRHRTSAVTRQPGDDRKGKATTLCTERTLEEFARTSGQDAASGPPFTQPETERRVVAMRDAILEVSDAMQTLNRGSPWDADAKVGDEFLTPLFQAYHNRLGLPNGVAKKDFHGLANHIPEEEIDPEVREKLDAIVAASKT